MPRAPSKVVAPTREIELIAIDLRADGSITQAQSIILAVYLNLCSRSRIATAEKLGISKSYVRTVVTDERVERKIADLDRPVLLRARHKMSQRLVTRTEIMGLLSSIVIETDANLATLDSRDRRTGVMAARELNRMMKNYDYEAPPPPAPDADAPYIRITVEMLRAVPERVRVDAVNKHGPDWYRDPNVIAFLPELNFDTNGASRPEPPKEIDHADGRRDADSEPDG